MVNIAKSFGKVIRSAQRTRRSVTGLLVPIWVVGCAVLSGIPDLDTRDGRVYAQRCGGCHGASHRGGHGVPDPRFRTMAEWQEVLRKMDRLIRERGLPPLTDAEREAIIRYLSHHAKS
jgi:mono/diheme cytochrome c family protein